jgi:hypothetical protein
MFSSYQHIATSHADLKLTVHDRINDLYRRAEKMATMAAHYAADSGCTNERPTGPRQAKAWDMIAEALAWNAISDDDAALALAEKYEGQRMPYRIAYSHSERGCQYFTVTPILSDPDAPTLAATVKSYPLTNSELVILHLALQDRVHWLTHPKLGLAMAEDDKLVTEAKTLHAKLWPEAAI